MHDVQEKPAPRGLQCPGCGTTVRKHFTERAAALNGSGTYCRACDRKDDDTGHKIGRLIGLGRQLCADTDDYTPARRREMERELWHKEHGDVPPPPSTDPFTQV